ncbi:MAG TPA: arabinose transporter [Rhodopila sp.]
MTASPATQAPTVVPPPANVFLVLLPITLVVFGGFLNIGVPLPVLSLHVHNTLGMSTLVVGAVIGAHYAAALLTRAWAGGQSDIHGPKRAVVTGGLSAMLSGVAYLASLAFRDAPAISVAVLVVGRLLAGCGESLIVTGALSWGVMLVGPRNAGKVMVWVGIAMYGAYAVGAPAGMAIYGRTGFIGIAVAAILLPLLVLGLVAFVRPVAPLAARRVPFYKVLSTVWVPGLGLAFCSSGFGAINAFIALLFAARNWGSASLAFTAFGLAFIVARLLFGHLPDKIGGAKVALASVAVEVVGQLLIWGAGGVWVAYLGAAFTGFGYSLAFPGFGVEAVRRAPPQSRGVAMGAFVAFLDVSLGITGPGAGAIAGAAGFGAVYLAGTVTVALSGMVAAYLLVNPPREAAPPANVQPAGRSG